MRFHDKPMTPLGIYAAKACESRRPMPEEVQEAAEKCCHAAMRLFLPSGRHAEDEAASRVFSTKAKVAAAAGFERVYGLKVMRC